MTGFPSTPTKKTSGDAQARRDAEIRQAYEDELKTPPRVTHQEHILRVQQLQEVNKHSSALQELEKVRAKAQYALEDAEEDLDEAYGKVNDSLPGLLTAFTPPASPSKPSVAQQSHAPIVSGGRVNLALVTPAVTPVASPVKNVYSSPRTVPQAYYIVYHGRGGMQGLFDGWKGPVDDIGPDSLCDGYEHRISKKFTDARKAQVYYDECKESGVLDVLQEEPTSDEILFVIKGAQPGVYTKRLSFLIDGLAWRGGIVMAANGTRAQASIMFNQWKVAGKVEVYPEDGPRRYF